MWGKSRKPCTNSLTHPSSQLAEVVTNQRNRDIVMGPGPGGTQESSRQALHCLLRRVTGRGNVKRSEEEKVLQDSVINGNLWLLCVQYSIHYCSPPPGVPEIPGSRTAGVGEVLAHGRWVVFVLQRCSAEIYQLIHDVLRSD